MHIARGILIAGSASLLTVLSPGAELATAQSVASDTAADPSPLGFWGEIECVEQARHQLVATGGDPRPTITGAAQGNDSFRRLTVFDGDNYWGERCELGNDNRRGRTAVYREGTRWITQISARLPQAFPFMLDTWQVVMQMKQAGPAANSSGTPVLSLDAYGGRWRFRQSRSVRRSSDSRELWSAPVTGNAWTRFSFDVRYSRSRKKGFVIVSADLTGDGDFTDPGESSHRIRTYTLKVETRGGDRDGIKPGRSIPSHLRAGIYHDEKIACPSPTGCSVDLDNVQLMRVGA